MVAKCANPSCESPFQFLHEGRLFLVDLSSTPPVKDLEFNEHPRKTEYFWLCGRCALTLTITSDKNGHLVLAPLETGPNAA